MSQSFISEEPIENLSQMPGHLIRRAQQICTAVFAEECAEFDMTPVQFAALVAIFRSPYVDATRLSQLIAFDRSTLGSVLERLETKGLVERNFSPHDRRMKLLSVTPAAAELLTLVLPAVRRAQARLLQPFTEPDRTLLVRLLTQFAEFHNEVTSVPLRPLPD